MKKLFYFLTLALSVGIMLCSCEKEGGALKSSDIVGSWVPTDDREISFYWEFTKDGMIKYYELILSERENYYDYDYDYDYCSFKDGTLYVPKNYEWKLTMYGDYLLADNSLFFDGINMGTIRKVNKDTFIFKSDWLVDGTVQRIKRFSTK